MYLKSLDSSTSDAKPSNADVLSWVDQAYKMLKQQKVCNYFFTIHTYLFSRPKIFDAHQKSKIGLFCTICTMHNGVKNFVTLHFNSQKQIEGNQILNPQL